MTERHKLYAAAENGKLTVNDLNEQQAKDLLCDFIDKFEKVQEQLWRVKNEVDTITAE